MAPSNLAPNAGSVYWVGSNNDIYLKAPTTSGAWGTYDIGPAGGGGGYSLSPSYINTPTLSYAANRIADPNPGGQVLGAVTNTPSGSGSTTGASPALANAIGASFDATQSALQNQLNAIPTYQQLQVGDTGNLYGTQAQNLSDQLQEGQAQLANSQTALDTQRSNSLKSLGDQLRSLYNNIQYQLPSGNVTANEVLGQGLTQEANNGRFQLGQQYGQQQTALNQQGSDLQQNFNDQMASLTKQKQQAIDNIIAQYQQTANQLNYEMASNLGDKARYLAIYGQSADLANQALSQLSQIQQQYGNAADNLRSQLAQGTAPSYALNSALTGGYQVQPFNVSQLPGITYQANAAPTTSTSTGPVVANLQRNDQQTPGTLGSLQQ